MLLLMALPICVVQAQTTTSWIGSTNNNDWATASNWSNGVPNATKHVIVGDAAFTGKTLPEVDEISLAECLTLTVGGGTKAAKVLVSTDKGLAVRGNVTILANGEIENEGSDILVEGNWTNNNIYLETIYTKGKSTRAQSVKNPTLTFSGIGKIIGGTSTNNFNNLTVSGSIQLASGINMISLTTTNNSINVQPTLTINGTLDPGAHLVSMPGSTTFVIGAGGTAFVKATTLVNGSSFYANYAIKPTTMYTNSTINYAGNDQVIESAITYGIIRVSGNGTKTLNGNSVVFGAQGTQLAVDAGTLDLGTYTFDRVSSPGGLLTIAPGATLRIGGTNTFPANFVTYTLDPNSTVEYYGTNQTVANHTYGHLILSTSGTKTMPTTAMTVAGNFTSTGAVSYTAGAALNIGGNVTIGSGTTFNGGSATHTVAGNWAANGTFVGNTSTVTMTGNSRTISSTAGTTEFNNLTLNGAGTSITVPTLTVRGNITAPGGLNQVADGTITMQNSSSKSINGSNINFQNLVIDGIVTAGSGFSVNGHFTANAGKSFTASAGTVIMSGASKTIAGAGSMNFWGLRISNATSTTSSLTINSSLAGASALVATAGIVSFGGTSTFGDTHYLYNAAVTGTKMQMLSGSHMYIAGAMTKTGSSTFDVSTTIPSYVYYNSINPQNVLSTNYHHLVLSNTGAKTAGGAVTVNGDITLATGTTFHAGAFVHTVSGNWINNGTFNHDNGTVSFAGGANSSITGATTFHTLALNKTSSSQTVTLNNEVTATNLQMINGDVITGSSKVTLLSNRTGNGWVVGTLTRSHAFVDGTAYAFNGPYAQLYFAAPLDINEVTVVSTSQSINDFTIGTPINRKYTISIPSGTYESVNLQLQYRDAELNGNDESALKLYHYDTGLAKWRTYGRTSLNSTENWVSRTSLASIEGDWTMSSSPSIYTWVGGTNTAWEEVSNWFDVTDGVAMAATSTPLNSDIAIFGEVVPANHPEINSSVSINSLQFKGVGKTDLNLTSGSLSVTNNLTAVGAGSSIVHALSTNGNSLTVGGNLVLNDGSTGNSIALSSSSGSIVVAGNIEHLTEASIALGSGNLTIGGNYNYTSGASFTAGTSTVTYNGTGAQTVAAVAYHHLTINKPNTSTATYTSGTAQTMAGNLTVSGSGSLSLSVPSLDIAGGVSVTGGTLVANSSPIDLKGNWATATTASFLPGTSTVTFSGGAAQTVSATTFNNLTVNKTSTLTTTGNLALNGNLDVQSGTLVMNGHTVNSSTTGRTLQLADGATILTRGTVGFPTNFTTNTLGVNSTVIYDAGSSSIAPVTYGYLTVQGSGTKSLQGNTQVANNMLIDAGAAIGGNTLANLTLAANLQNDGTLNTVRTNLLFTGVGVQLNGNGSTTIDDLTVNAGASLIINKNVRLEGSLTNNGASLDATSAELDFIGADAASITSTSTPISIGNLKITKSNAAVTLGADVVSLQALNINGGTFDMGSRTITKAATTTNTSLTVAAGATLKVGGTNTLPVLDNYTFNQTSNMVYNGGAQTVKAVNYGNLSLENAGTKTLEAGTTGVAGSYTLAGSASADMLVNNSILNFNGTGAQSIPGLYYNSILVSGGSEKTLAANATVANELRLTNGTVLTGTNKFILGNTARVVEDENNYVTGLVEAQRLLGTELETFGDIGLSIDSDIASGMVTVIRETGAVVGLNSNSAKRNFRILPAGTNENLNATITLSYFLHEIGSIQEGNLSVYSTTDDVLWYLQPEENTTRNSTRKTVALTGVNSLTRITLGDRMSPLPVDLGYFKAEKKGQNAILTWTTTNEDDNKGFEVEVSTDGQRYRKIGFVSKGTGTSRVAILYTFTDKEPGKQGTRYYRLRQVDFDGRMRYYGPRALTFDKETGLAVTAYPNPFQTLVSLSIPAEAGGTARIRLYDTAGKVLLEQTRSIESGTNNLVLDTAGKTISAGMYVVTVETGGQLQRLKLMKE
nr:T9SS type A sorting domain-containing protein [Pontibacter aydingkolensis]